MPNRAIRARTPELALAIALLLIACAPEPPAQEPIARGRQVYQRMNCGACHDANLFGQRSAPPLEHIGTIAMTRRPDVSAADYIRESIVDPGAYVVPGYPDAMPRALGRDLTPTDLEALVTYLASLK